MATIVGLDMVRTEAQERLDKPDFDAVSALVDEGIQRQIGAMFGQGGGLASAPTTTIVGGLAASLKLSAFQYYISLPAWTDATGNQKGWKGAFLTFDPASGSQSNLVDLSAAAAAAAISGAGAYPYIYVRPFLIAADTDARRKWTGAGDTAVSMQTRSRVKHEFKLSMEEPTATNNLGWAPIYKLNAWSAYGVNPPGNPSFKSISFFDNPNDFLNTDEPGTSGVADWTVARSTVGPILDLFNGIDTINADPLTAGAALNNKPNKDVGLIQLLQKLRYRLVVLLDSVTEGRKWYGNPSDAIANPFGILQIANKIEALTSSIGSVRTLVSGVIKQTWDAGIGAFVNTFEGELSGGALTLTSPNADAGVLVASYTYSQANAFTFLAAFLTNVRLGAVGYFNVDDVSFAVIPTSNGAHLDFQVNTRVGGNLSDGAQVFIQIQARSL